MFLPNEIGKIIDVEEREMSFWGIVGAVVVGLLIFSIIG